MENTKKHYPPSVKPPRIIVVDEHDWIREIAVQVVQQTLPQADIVAKRDGLEALMAFLDKGADFVITNQFMPHLNGAELIQELHAQAPDLPIVMISVDPAARATAEAAGANWFLTKAEIMERMPPLLLQHIPDVTGTDDLSGVQSR